MAIFGKRDGDSPAKGKAAAGSAPPGGEAASNGASAPDGADAGDWHSEIPRGNLLYLADGYGLHSRDSVPSNGASLTDGEEAVLLTGSGLPRGKFLYITAGYGPLPDED